MKTIIFIFILMVSIVLSEGDFQEYSIVPVPISPNIFVVQNGMVKVQSVFGNILPINILALAHITDCDINNKELEKIYFIKLVKRNDECLIVDKSKFPEFGNVNLDSVKYEIIGNTIKVDGQPIAEFSYRGPTGKNPGGYIVCGSYVLISSINSRTITILRNNSNISVETPGLAIPQKFELTFFPNPLRNSLNIQYGLPSTGRLTQYHVSLSIFNARGQLVRLLAIGKIDAGRRSVRWDGKDNNGLSIATGQYFLSFKAVGTGNTFSQKRSLVVLR